MKSKVLILLLFLSSTSLLAQVQFEKGYLINNSGERINCLIKNLDWRNNPSEFIYKLTEDESETTANISTVKEFGIEDHTRFVRGTVQIDRSTSIGVGRNPNLKEEQLFLRVVLEGRYSLYIYQQSSITRFFIGETGSEDIEYLIYKKYYTTDNLQGENNYYRQQLINHLACDDINLKTVDNIQYDRISLTNLFITYHKCVNQHIVVYNQIGITYELFEKGYLIDNYGQKIECLVKNERWKSNPESFVYKLDADGIEKIASISNVQAFGIDNRIQYIRSKVRVDLSASESQSRSPDFEERILFLELLFKGDYSLFQYKQSRITRFFYKAKGSSEMEQLVYKKYTASNGDVRENNYYQQQLFNNLNCQSIKSKEVMNIGYEKEALTDFFTKYHECKKSDYIDLSDRRKSTIKSTFRIRPRMNYSSMVVGNEFGGPPETEFGNKIGFGFGLEWEMILPFNNGSWGLSIEPTYHGYSSETETNISFSTVTYRSIEIHITGRRYFFLGDKSKLFTNMSLVVANNEFVVRDQFGSEITYYTKPNFALGLGHEYKNSWVLELRYQTTRNGRFVDNLDFQTLSMIIGVKLN